MPAILVSILVTAAGCRAYAPASVIAEQVAPGVHGRMVYPDAPGPRPGVLMLHGASGWTDPSDPEAHVLAESGFVVLVLDYYRGGNDLINENAARTPARLREAWLDNIAAGARTLAADPAVEPNNTGIVGFSRGAQFGLEHARRSGTIHSVVDYYGLLYDYADDRRPTAASVEGLPPTLILHGEEDQVVDIGFGEEIRDWMLAAGQHVEFVSYPGMGHAWWLPGPPSEAAEAALQDSLMRTIGFLSRWSGVQ